MMRKSRFTRTGCTIRRWPDVHTWWLPAVVATICLGSAYKRAYDNSGCVRQAHVREAEQSMLLNERIADEPLVREYARVHGQLRYLALKYRIGIPAHIGFDYWLR
jgi:hypothetical protein